MNFFFHTNSDKYKSKITIPKFQNCGAVDKNLDLFSANIINNEWIVNKIECNETSHFWTVTCQNNDNEIYFIASELEASLIQQENKLIALNNFTTTSPDYRANLEIKNTLGGFSSYQSEYPHGMTTRLASLYTECGNLTFDQSNSVGIFIKNIYFEPIHDSFPIFLYDDLEERIINTFDISLNNTNFIDLTQYKERLANCFLFAPKFMGVPIYVVEHSDGGLSFEHTHPPTESIAGADRFNLIKGAKERANEKISQTSFSQ